MSKNKEIWKTIKGHPNHEVSNYGRVRSLNYHGTGKTQMLSLLNSKTGYKFVILDKKTCYVHRLVAEAFIPNPDNLPQINHKDENKDNNIVSNLEWCSAKYNINYGNRNKHLSETCQKKRKERSVRIEQFKKQHSLNQVQNIQIRKEQIMKRIEELREKLVSLECDEKATRDEIQRLLMELEKSDEITKWDRHAVIQYTMDGQYVKEWRSAYDIQKELSICVNPCLRGKSESVSGFRWVYKIPREV